MNLVEIFLWCGEVKKSLKDQHEQRRKDKTEVKLQIGTRLHSLAGFDFQLIWGKGQNLMTIVGDEIFDPLKGSMLGEMPRKEALKTLKTQVLIGEKWACLVRAAGGKAEVLQLLHPDLSDASVVYRLPSPRTSHHHLFALYHLIS